MSELEDLMREIRESLREQRGTFGLVRTEDAARVPQLVGTLRPFTLAMGIVRPPIVIPPPNPGTIMVLGLTRNQVLQLRAMCDECLGTPEKS